MEGFLSAHNTSHYLNNIKNQDWKTVISNLYAPATPHTIAPTNVAEEMWIGLVNYFGDFYMLIAFYLFMNLSYVVGGVMFWVADKFHLLHKYKVQPEKYPTKIDYIKCLQNLITNYILIIFPLIFLLYPIFSSFSFRMTLPLPSLFTVIWQFAFCLIVEDVGHYWLHRILHTQYLYKTIHKIHHKYSAPFGFAASYSHPLEVLILGIPTFVGPVIIGCHYSTFFLWVLFRQLDAVGTHSGYDLPHLFDLLPYYGGIKVHDFHHKNFIFNYSSRFTFMDKWFGTYKAPP